MAELRLEGLGKSFPGPAKGGGAVWAVRDVTLTIRAGEFLTLLGPSGCGKTTTLRMIAGFTAPSLGRIVLDGRVLSSADERISVPPERRGMGMVFQSFAVWPHMTAAENVAYPLRRAGVPRAETARRTADALRLVHLDGLGSRYPAELSGGQQQRVALARALVTEPAVLLLDEPLSNLDAKLREQMRAELRELHERLHVTIVYVTHDQGEAMSLSDRIMVLLGGRAAQIGTPRELYERPADPVVAAFVGNANFMPAEVIGQEGTAVRVRLLDGTGLHALRVSGPPAIGRVLVCARPEALAFAQDGELAGRVVRASYLGNRIEYLVKVGDLLLRVEARSEDLVDPGDTVRLAVRRAVLYPAAASAVTSSGDRTT